jgi:5-hydroxyisourate hydrolase-like protein (transthyretin family)
MDKDGLSYHPAFLSPTPQIVLEAEKPIRGTIKDGDTGKPLAGLKVRLTQGWRLRLPELSATTDANGHYEIHGAKKAASYELRVNRDVKAGFLGRTVKFVDKPAYEPIEANMTLAKGIVLTGRVLDTSTGKPVSGYACIGILSDNEFIKSRPEYSSPDCYDFAYTDKDGRYRTIVPPGAILLMGGPMPGPVDGEQPYFRYQQLRPDPDYPQYFSKNVLAFHSIGGSFMMMQGMYCKVLKLKPDQKEYTADVLITPASRFRVKIQDAAGKPLKGATVAGNTSRDWMFPQVCKDDTCIVYELENAKPRVLAFHGPGGKLVGVLTLKGDEKEPAVARLGPPGRLKGKIVNQAGQPMANLRLQVNYLDRAVDEIGRSWRDSPIRKGSPIETNAQGEFELENVIPGARFSIYGRKGNKYLERVKGTPGGAFVAKPSETTDLGTIALKDE